MSFPLNEFYSRIYNRYDLINRLFTLGMDQLWRKHTVRQCLLNDPANILDLCCGTGDLTIMLARYSRKDISITGFDLNTQMLEMAKQKSEKKGCRNIHFMQGDASKMPFADNNFDCITIGFGFRNLTYENPNRSSYISEIFRILKNGGLLLVLESGHPENKWIRLFFKGYLYTILIPIGFLISCDSKAYRYLAQSAAGFFSVDEIYKMLSEKGFEIRERKIFFFGAANLFTVRKP
jgi:demethylmenaquinone methyltransferase/2-methoxy-6-polyprenyl-1,4-benzoquinol methylase